MAASTPSFIMKYKKYLIGFAVFFGYFLLASQIKNRVSLVRKLAGDN